MSLICMHEVSCSFPSLSQKSSPRLPNLFPSVWNICSCFEWVQNDEKSWKNKYSRSFTIYLKFMVWSLSTSLCIPPLSPSLSLSLHTSSLSFSLYTSSFSFSFPLLVYFLLTSSHLDFSERNLRPESRKVVERRGREELCEQKRSDFEHLSTLSSFHHLSFHSSSTFLNPFSSSPSPFLFYFLLPFSPFILPFFK